MANRQWIRRDRETGKTQVVTEEYVAQKIEGYYIEIDVALNAACEKNPVTTGFADYYPTEGK